MTAKFDYFQDLIDLLIAETHARRDKTLKLNAMRPDVPEHIEPFYAQLVKQMPTCEGIQVQIPYVCYYGDADLKALTDHAEYLPNLTYLDFSHTNVTDKGVQAFAARANKFRSLRYLAFSDTRVGNRGLKALAAQVQHLQSLECLAFNNTRVSDDGLKALASVRPGMRNPGVFLGFRTNPASKIVVASPIIGVEIPDFQETGPRSSRKNRYASGLQFGITAGLLSDR